MTIEQHQKEVEKLHTMEKELTNRIVETGDFNLMDTFEAWIEQRNVCNEGFVSAISEGLNSENKIDRQDSSHDRYTVLESKTDDGNLCPYCSCDITKGVCHSDSRCSLFHFERHK